MRALLFYFCLPLIVAVGLRRPIWGLAIYLCANIIRPEMLFWGGNTGALIFKVSLGSALLGFLVSHESKVEPLAVRELWLVLWISLAVTVSLILTAFPSAPRVWDYVGEFYKLLIVCWLLLGTMQKKQQALNVIDILLFMAMLLSLWGWDQSLRGNERLEGLGGQAFGDSNGVAAFGVLFLPLALHKLFTANKWWQKIFGLDATILIAGLIVLTNSRGGFLGLVAGSCYLFLISPKKKWLGMCYLIILLGATLLLPDKYLTRIATIESDQEQQRDASSGGRLVLWQAGWLIFKDNPVFGVGLLNFAQAKAPYRSQLAGQFDSDLLDYSFQGYKVGHSTWFGQVLPEGGLFLAIPMSWLIVGFFWRARRLQWARPPTEETRPLYNALIGLEAGLFGYCVSISFIDSLLMPFLTVLVMLGVQLIRIIERVSEAATQPTSLQRDRA